MSLDSAVRIFDDPREARMHMAALISAAYLQEAREAMAKENPAVPQIKKRKSRKSPLPNPAVKSRREKRQQTQSAAQTRRSHLVHEESLKIEDQALTSFETPLQELKDTLTAVPIPETTNMVSAWAQRQLLTDAKLSAERVITQKCHRCSAVEAVVRCLDCVPLDMEFLCATCDVEAHKRNVFHDREAVFHGFFEPIPPTTAVVMDDNGQPQFCEQLCQLPVSTRAICECSQDLTVIPGKHISVVTINGKYDVCLPQKSCPSCSTEWTPEVKDLLRYRYWPATTSCQTLFKFDVFTTFEHMKMTAPAMSRQAFLKMLEHRSVQADRQYLC
ncbi:uncharacterized protein LOC115367433 isoform X2 [Myripristis murdjan]|uniref:uncharacterized protein LOC115367433 isoform X2 n=1 Tax=Myripristis murdjan TaxID=586833 RepID=UPI00117649CD|nr:uncharacterized protein LOC115367433 isoform X2 [Myripristis murdjan]